MDTSHELSQTRFSWKDSNCSILHTDKKEKKIFLIYEEIQNGAVAKLYMTTGGGLLIYGDIFSHFLRVSEVFRKNKKGVCYHPR